MQHYRNANLQKLQNQAFLEQATKEEKKSKNLLQVAHLTASATGTENLIAGILDCAKLFVRAEVCSLFLVDPKKHELYSLVYNGGVQQKIR